MNRFANIPGSALISESFNLINEGFDAVEQELDGLDTLSPADRAKLDSVEVGAQVNQNAYAKVNGMEADDPSDEMTISGGTGITVTTNPITKDVIITATGTATPGPHGSSHLEFGSDPIPYASTSQGGLMSAADKQTVADMASHLTDTNNPHGVTAAQVGLGNVQNYGIASQEQAEAGTASNVYMTPQRTKDYVDTRLLNGISFRRNDGVLEAWNSEKGEWEPMGTMGTFPAGRIRSASLELAQDDQYVTVLDISGAAGRIELLYATGGSGQQVQTVSMRVTIDGKVEEMTETGTGGKRLDYLLRTYGGTNEAYGNVSEPIYFNNSLKVEAKKDLGNLTCTVEYRLRAGTP